MTPFINSAMSWTSELLPDRVRFAKAAPGTLDPLNLGGALPPDPRRSQGMEVRYWTKTLGISEEELRAAVKFVGDGADAVREYLKR
jgi:hypothetical protein